MVLFAVQINRGHRLKVMLAIWYTGHNTIITVLLVSVAHVVLAITQLLLSLFLSNYGGRELNRSQARPCCTLST